VSEPQVEAFVAAIEAIQAAAEEEEGR